MIFIRGIFLLDLCDFSWPGEKRGGGGVLPMMAYKGRLPKKGLPFSGLRYVKGREICHLGL